jgi:hypothetical protein
MCSACSENYQGDYENPEDDDTAGSGTGSDSADSTAQADAGRHRNAHALRPSAASGAGAAGKLHGHDTSRCEESYHVFVGTDRIVEIRILRAKSF